MTRRLDEAQTDLSGVPTWQQIEGMRTLLNENHTKVQATWERFAEEEHARLTTAATLMRAQTFGLVVLAAIAGAAAMFGGSVLIVGAWKRRAEFWIGYSSQDPGTSPLWFTFIMGAAAASVALALTFFTPLWRILGGSG